MTVIFHTNAGLPVLAGDMLISTSGPRSFTDLKLPSHPEGIVIPSDPVPRNIPIKMRRKIFVINDHLVVGAAGDVISIRTFIQHLIDAFGDRPIFASQEVKEFLNGYASSTRGRDVFDQIHFVLLVEAQDWRGSFTRGWPAGTDVFSDRFGKVIAIGSGSERIIDQIRRLDRYATGSAQPEGGDEKFPEFKPLQANLALLANVYWKELISPGNVFQAWGGAYDLIYQGFDRVFRHLSDYTLIVRRYDANQPAKGIQLTNVMKYERQPNVSYIAMPTARGLEFFGAKDITASSAPETIQLSKGQFTMNSKYHVSIIEVGRGNKFAPPLIQIDGWDPDGRSNPTILTWFNEEGRLCTWFEADHDEWLKEQAISHYARYATALSL